MLLALGALFVDKKMLAEKSWQSTHTPSLSLFIAPSAALASEIANYYFNVEESGVYDLVKARKYFEKSLELNPEEPLAWYQLARIDFLEGKSGEALQKANKQILLHGDTPQSVYYLRALIYGYDKQFREAELNFLLFLKWKPESWAAHNDLAWIYFQEGDFNSAERVAKEGLESNPQNAWLLNILGVSLLNEKRSSEAHDILVSAAAAAGKLSPLDWQRAYPGNDPAAAAKALQEMQNTIAENLALTVRK